MTISSSCPQIRNDDGKTASEACQETETKAEFEKWELSAGIRKKSVGEQDYGDSSSDEEGGNGK